MGFIRFAESIKSRKRTSVSLSSLLSEKELSVALYAAEGLSNKDIAVKVYLSESRIKTSLSAIYRKLGITDKKDKRNILAEILNV
jgi:DNA-binding NarL/FixJ family response regulator